MIRKLITAGLGLLLCLCLGAAPAYADELVKRVFSSRDGLINTSILDISMDERGFIWLSTEQGLYRLSNANIRRLDRDGLESRMADEYLPLVKSLGQQQMLVSTLSHAYLYHIADNRFRQFGSDELFPEYQGGGLMKSLKSAAGDWLLLTEKGQVWRLSQDLQQLQKLFDLPYDSDLLWSQILQLENGDLLLGNAYGVELRSQNGSVKQRLSWQGSYGRLNALFLDSNNQIWMAASKGFYRVNLESNRIEAVAEIPFFTSVITEDLKGNLWIASKQGLLKWSPRTRKLKQFKEQLKLRAGIEYINALQVDSNGLIWVGGTGHSLAVVADSPEFLLDSFSASEPYKLSDEMVWTILADDEMLWLGTDSGVIAVNRKTQQTKTAVPRGMEVNDSIYKIDNLDSEHLLLSSTNGLFVMNKQTLEGQPLGEWSGSGQSLSHKTVLNTLHEGNLWWFATSNGLYEWDKEQGSINKRNLPGAEYSGSNPIIYSVYRDSSERLWVGGNKSFGYLEQGGGFRSLATVFDDLPHMPTVSQLLELSPDRFWLATRQGGLIELDLQTMKIRRLTQEWQLDCNTVFFLQDTGDYRMVGCTYVLIRQDKHSGEIKVFNDDDGLLGKELNEGAYFYAPQQGLYVGTPDGVMLLDVDSLVNRIPRHGAILESIAAYYDNKTELSLVPTPGQLIAPGARMLSFQLTSMDYLDDAPISLKYRLRRPGEDERNYLLLENQSQINLSGLIPGAYQLEVLSQNNGIWQSEPFRFPFTVDLFWWQSRWFKGLLVVALLAMVFTIVLLRQRQVRRFMTMNLALRQSDDRLRQSLRGSESDLWEWRRDTGLFHLDNRGGVLGSDEDFILIAIDKLPVHPDDQATALDEWNKMVEGESDRFESEYRYRRRDGSWGWLRVRGRPVSHDPVSGKVSKAAGIYSDITIKRQLEDEVELLAQAFENTSEGVFILDADEVIKVANRAAESIVGQDRHSLQGRHFGELVVSENFHKDNVATLLQGVESWTGELEIVGVAGSRCPVWLNISSMQDLKERVQHYVVVFSDITERKRTEADLRRLANYDVLTGLPNRSLFANRLQQAIDRADDKQQKLALLFLDLDRFKHVNDSYGHSMGDALLVEAANRLQSVMDQEQVLCRFGGDEFVILVNEAEIDKLNRLCERLLAQIAQPFELYGREFFISTSIGISIWPDDARQPEALIKNADQAMYHAKEEGRGNFQYYSSERNAEALYHLKLEAMLRHAIEQGEFELYYQGQFDVKEQQKFIGMEALLRWHHPSEGFVRPDIFIKVAESCGLIVAIDRWVLRQACEDGARWSQSAAEPFKLSVNVSAVHFRHPEFISGVLNILEETGMPAEYLALEITEGVLMKELHIARQHLKQLRAHGIEVAIDDFGTGYSSLAYLRHFEVNTLKIDRSFLKDIAGNSADQAIVSSIVELARNLRLKVVAEGVETREQLQQVTHRGCHIIQGYYFAKPVPAAELASWFYETHHQ
ncbi:diguanylate cyclase [Shewanella algae]|uniref:EAL domain-containing protein n=1 Tax=Shewanella algae TaxID=38313 RepID=UPI000D19A2E0|nr:EAL domain-containing protein [Shewanella algae]PSS74174.1 diguanylate cyclase [Shewanella algae]TVK98108.1 diguanylate cyclase [Shewanella algae]